MWTHLELFAVVFINARLSLSLTLRIGKSLCSRRVFFLLQKNSSSCLDSCNFLTKVKSLSSAIYGDGSLLPTPVNLSVTNRSYTSISLQWEAVKNTNGSPVYMIEIELIKRGLRNIPINMKKVKWIKLLIFLYFDLEDIYLRCFFFFHSLLVVFHRCLLSQKQQFPSRNFVLTSNRWRSREIVI